jgi:hypothetical protein
MRRAVVASSLVLAILAATPMQAAVAAKPIREPFSGVGRFSGLFVIPAGEDGCSFDIRVEFDGQGIGWRFRDGRLVTNNIATQTLTNLGSGTSYVHRSDYHVTDRLLADGSGLLVIDGKYMFLFFEGDQGPEGEVGPGGALYFITGHFEALYDPVSLVGLSWEGHGRAVEVCQLLQ